MVELVKFMAEQLASEKENVSVAAEGETITITVKKSDMGRLIGKQGRIAKAIRTIVKAASVKENKKYVIDIVET